MKALNHKERNDLTWKFIILFIVTVSLSVFAIFFDFQLPKKLSEQHKKKLEAYRQFVKNEKLIIQKIDSLESKISAFGNSGMSIAIEENEVIKEINKFDELVNIDSTSIKICEKMNQVFKGYLGLKVKSEKEREAAKDMEKDLNEKEADLKEKKEDLKELQDCERKLKECGC